MWIQVVGDGRRRPPGTAWVVDLRGPVRCAGGSGLTRPPPAASLTDLVRSGEADELRLPPVAEWTLVLREQLAALTWPAASADHARRTALRLGDAVLRPGSALDRALWAALASRLVPLPSLPAARPAAAAAADAARRRHGVQRVDRIGVGAGARPVRARVTASSRLPPSGSSNSA